MLGRFKGSSTLIRRATSERGGKAEANSEYSVQSRGGRNAAPSWPCIFGINNSPWLVDVGWLANHVPLIGPQLGRYLGTYQLPCQVVMAKHYSHDYSRLPRCCPAVVSLPIVCRPSTDKAAQAEPSDKTDSQSDDQPMETVTSPVGPRRGRPEGYLPR